MKRATILLGTLVLMIFGFLFAAPAVQAQTPLDTISNGGVTCKQYATTYDWQTAATDTFGIASILVLLQRALKS